MNNDLTLARDGGLVGQNPPRAIDNGDYAAKGPKQADGRDKSLSMLPLIARRKICRPRIGY